MISIEKLLREFLSISLYVCMSIYLFMKSLDLTMIKSWFCDPPKPLLTKVGLRWEQRASIPSLHVASFLQQYREDPHLFVNEGYFITPYPHPTLIRWSVTKPYYIPQYEKTILYPYQQQSALLLTQKIAKYNVAWDNSDTGTGKTPKAIAICRENGFRPFILCPKAVIDGWVKWCQRFEVDPLGIVNYELGKNGKMYLPTSDKLIAFSNPYLKVKRVYTPNQPKKMFEWSLPPYALLIFDEAQYCQNTLSQTSQLMYAAARKNVRSLLVSASLGVDPTKMGPMGALLDLFPIDGYIAWMHRHCCKEGEYGWFFWGNTSEIMKIRTEIGDKMTGVRKQELILRGEFPETQILAECYNLFKDKAKLDEVYTLWGEQISALESKAESYKRVDTIDLSLPIHQKFHQIAELLKIEIIVELAKTRVEEGNAVIIFCNYVQTIENLARRLNGLKYYGHQTHQQNEAARQCFQANKNPILICNIMSGGTGIDLHDIHHTHPRVVLLCPTFEAIKLLQAMGRAHRVGGTASQQIIIFVAGTVEEKICKKVNKKLQNLGTLIDTDLQFF